MSADRTRPPPTAGPRRRANRTVITPSTTQGCRRPRRARGHGSGASTTAAAQRIEQLVAEGADGGRHQPCGLVAVARLQGAEQRAVLVARSQAAPAGAGAQGDQARALAVVQQPRDDERRPAVAARGGDADVDGAVGLHEAIDRGRVVEVERRLRARAQVGELVGRDPPGRGRRGGWLEQQAQVVDLADVADRERGDDVAAAGLGQDQALRAQARERGADRGLGEPEARDELRLGHRRSRLELEAHDRVAQPLVRGRPGPDDGGSCHGGECT